MRTPKLNKTAIQCGVLLAALIALPAHAVIVSMQSPACVIGNVTAGTAMCSAALGEIVDVTFALDSTESLAGYDLEIRWDATELTLVSATPLFPSSGTAEPFLLEPMDPTDSRATAFTIIIAPTDSLFRLSFSVNAQAEASGDDLWWFPSGAGLSPATVVLENPGGAAIDFKRAIPAPAMGPGGLLLFWFALWSCGVVFVRWRSLRV
jgi:hypothetical protein